MSLWTSLTGFFTGGVRRTEGPLRNPTELTPTGIGALDKQLQVSVAYAAYRRLVSDCAGLTVIVKSEDGLRVKKSEVLRKFPALYPFLRRANPSMSAYQLLMRINLDLATFSQHLSRRIYTAGVLSLEPLDLRQWRPVREKGKVTYHNISAPNSTLQSEDVFHVVAFGDGLIGFSASENMASAAGLSASAESASGALYANGMRPAGVIFSKDMLNDEQVERVKKNYGDVTNGFSTSRLWLFEAAMTYEPINFTAEDAQLLQTRRFQIAEVCRFIGVPPFLVFENSDTTTLGSSLEEMIAAYYDGPIKHHANAIARAIESQLLTDAQSAQYEVGFDLDTARLASYKSRVEAHSIAVQTAQLTPDEARAREGYGPLPGGDKLFVQGALRPTTEPYKVDTAGTITPSP